MKKYYLATLVSLIYIPLITIGGELYKPLKDFLKNTFWHHWLGKSVILIALFILAALVFQKSSEKENDSQKIITIIVLSLLGGSAIFIFFVFEYIKT